MYSLLQITDSLFPSGAFAHSYGLEGLLQQSDRLPDSMWPSIVGGILSAHLLHSDGLLGLRAHRAMVRGDIDGVCDVDRQLYAMKLPRELREASVSTGRSFLMEASCVVPSRDLGRICAIVEAGASPGNHAIAFQAVAAAISIDEHQSLIAWGYQTVTQMAAALLRLGVLGHRGATSLIAALQPIVQVGVRHLLDGEATDVASFAPQLEIASMRHERQYSRLFRS